MQIVLDSLQGIDGWFDKHPWILPVTFIPLFTAVYMLIANKLGYTPRPEVNDQQRKDHDK